MKKSVRHETQLFRVVHAIVLGITVVLVAGCQTLPTSFDQGLQLIEKAADVAEKQGTAYSATIRWDGKLGAAWIQRGELDSGVTVEVSFHGNAAAERAAVKPELNPDP